MLTRHRNCASSREPKNTAHPTLKQIVDAIANPQLSTRPYLSSSVFGNGLLLYLIIPITNNTSNIILKIVKAI